MELRPYRPGDEVAITELDGLVWKRGRTVADWLWRYRDCPHGPALVTLAWDGDRLAGHYAVTPVPLHYQGRVIHGWLSSDTMTHPDHRGRGLFGQVVFRTVGRMPRGSFWYGFPNAQSHRIFARDLDRRDIYQIPTLRLSGIGSLPQPDGVVDSGPEVVDPHARVPLQFDYRFDDLWRRVHPQFGVMSRRDSATLNWRYACKPGNQYRLLTLPDGEAALDGYAVYHLYKGELQIVDLFAWDIDSALRLVAGVAARRGRHNAGSVALWLSVHDPLHQDLERAGFGLDAPVFYFSGRTGTGTPDEFYNAREWHLAMGDSDVF